MAKTLDYNFAVDKSLVADTGPTLTCTRSGDATYFDASGVLQTAGTNTARFDHDPSDSNASLGLLIEEVRTNLLTWTESFDNAAWNKYGVACAGADIDAAVAPDGTTTADRINVTAGGTLHAMGRGAVTVTVGATYTTSAYFKDDGARYVYIVYSGNTNVYVTAVFDLTAATVTNTYVGSGGGTYVDSDIEDVGNGWYRCWVTGSVPTVGAAYPNFGCSDSGAPTLESWGRPTYTGVDGEDVFCWGADLQAGSFPTSYIPNDSATASVTRAADVVKTTDVSWAGTSHTFYAEASKFTDTNGYVFSLNNNTTMERAIMYTIGLDFGPASLVFTGTDWTPTLLPYNNFSLNTPIKAALGIADDDAAFYTDGVLKDSTSSITSPGVGVAFLTLDIGHANNETLDWNGHIARIAYWDSRLTDAELEDLSNGTFPTPPATGMEVGDDDWFRRRRMMRRHRRLYARR